MSKRIFEAEKTTQQPAAAAPSEAAAVSCYVASCPLIATHTTQFCRFHGAAQHRPERWESISQRIRGNRLLIAFVHAVKTAPARLELDPEFTIFAPSGPDAALNRQPGEVQKIYLRRLDAVLRERVMGRPQHKTMTPLRDLLRQQGTRLGATKS